MLRYMKRVMNDIKKALVNELHKPARRNYPRRKVDIRGIDETWQADLVIMNAYSDENNGYKNLLTVIDNFSKYAWAVPLKDKSGDAITAALKSIFIKGRVPKNLHVDKGTEFYNKKCKALLKKYNVNLYSTFSEIKASIIERFNRTLKSKMWKMFSLRGSYKWNDIIGNLVSEYNNTKHRTIKMKPKDVKSKNESSVFKKYFNYKLKNDVILSKFKVGDEVRISKYKHIFEKAYTPKVINSIHVTCKLKDYQAELLDAGF